MGRYRVVFEKKSIDTLDGSYRIAYSINAFKLIGALRRENYRVETGEVYKNIPVTMTIESETETEEEINKRFVEIADEIAKPSKDSSSR